MPEQLKRRIREESRVSVRSEHDKEDDDAGTAEKAGGVDIVVRRAESHGSLRGEGDEEDNDSGLAEEELALRSNATTSGHALPTPPC